MMVLGSLLRVLVIPIAWKIRRAISSPPAQALDA
jgi:hypothetical protein